MEDKQALARRRAKVAIREARGSVGRLLDAAGALEPTKARGEVTSRGKWLLTAIGNLETAIAMTAEAEQAGAEAARCLAGYSLDDPGIEHYDPVVCNPPEPITFLAGEGEAHFDLVEPEPPAARVLGEGPADDTAPMPHHGEHAD